jgi:hypothetical protein
MAGNIRIKPVEQATNRSWDEWLGFMERIGAADLDHRAIAAKVQEELGESIDNPGWWAQSVTVAYEQHIGRRVPGQRSDGTFEMSVSKSTKLGMRELMDAWEAFAAADGQVQEMIAAQGRVSGTDKRITWRTKAADGSAIRVTSEPKSGGTASLVATQSGLASHERNVQARAWWTAIVQRFADTVGER